MQTEIKQSELQLTQNKHCRLIVLRCQHIVEQRLRQRLTGFIMTGDKGQRLRLPAPVFHKLTRQLDRIPRHTIDTGNVRHINLCQHMMQAVSELMEQRQHFIMGKQRRFAADRFVKVTGQIRNRFLQGIIFVAHTADAVIHPRPAAFVLTGIQIQIETAA